MKTQILFAATVALCLTACGQTADKAAQMAQSTEAAQPAKDAATTAATGAFSKDYMVGKWADAKDGDCALAQDFKADGTVDGAFDSWSVSGSELQAMMAGEKMVFAVKVVDAKSIDVVSPQGKKSRLVRC